MIRRPPRSTLFPYTSSSDLAPGAPSPASEPERGLEARGRGRGGARERARVRPSGPGRHRDWRSEEHTSELQSRQYLVCRLLLEKKNLESPTYSYKTTTKHYS